MRTDKPTPYHLLRDPERRAAHRRRAVAEVASGTPLTHVAQRYGVSRETMYTWLERANAHGGEVRLRSSARPFKLAVERHEELRQLVREGPRAAGFEWDAWSLPRLRELVRVKFNAEYSDGGIALLMRRLGFSPQKPERRARERNEEVIATWMDTVLPEVEKKSGARGGADRRGRDGDQ